MNNKKIINCTPHDVSVKLENGEIITYKPSGSIARVVNTEEYINEDINGIPLIKSVTSEPFGVPAPQKDTLYIVATMVLESPTNTRYDLIAPNTGMTACRDSNGRIKYVTSFKVKA